MSLSDAFPGFTPVTVGGATLRACGARLRGLATLERWARLRLESPIADLDDPRPDYPGRLRDAYDAARDWPPEIGAEAIDGEIFGTPEGQCLFLLEALRLENPTLEDAAGWLAAMAENPAEWEAVERVALGADASPFPEVVRRIDAHIGCPPYTPRRLPPSGCVSWGEAIARACDGDPTKLEAIGDLWLCQWRLVRAGGKREKPFEPLPSDREAEKVVQGLRRDFWRAGRKTKPTVSPTPQSDPSPPSPGAMPGRA